MTHAEYVKAAKAWRDETKRVAASAPEPPKKEWSYGDTIVRKFTVHEGGMWIYDGRVEVSLSPDDVRLLREFINEHFPEEPAQQESKP